KEGRRSFKELKEERPDLSIRDVHSVVLRLTRWHGEEERKNCLDDDVCEELLIDVGKFPALLDYCQ
ncbi:12167_t:CDS:2, partial [Ambispora gerdemannii]